LSGLNQAEISRPHLQRESISATFESVVDKLQSNTPTNDQIKKVSAQITEDTVRFYDGNKDGKLETNEIQEML
jgi:hypothetical protein